MRAGVDDAVPTWMVVLVVMVLVLVLVMVVILMVRVVVIGSLVAAMVMRVVAADFKASFTSRKSYKQHSTDRNGSPRISATIKFDVPGG